MVALVSHTYWSQPKLTGRFRYRRSWWSRKLILQVETSRELMQGGFPYGPGPGTKLDQTELNWIDAQHEHMQALVAAGHWKYYGQWLPPRRNPPAPEPRKPADFEERAWKRGVFDRGMKKVSDWNWSGTFCRHCGDWFTDDAFYSTEHRGEHPPIKDSWNYWHPERKRSHPDDIRPSHEEWLSEMKEWAMRNKDTGFFMCNSSGINEATYDAIEALAIERGVGQDRLVSELVEYAMKNAVLKLAERAAERMLLGES